MIFWIRSLPNNKQAPFTMPMSPAVFVYGALDVPPPPALAAQLQGIVKKIWLHRICIQLNDNLVGLIE